MNALIIGGTLFIGRSLVLELTKAGYDVTVMHRKPGHDLGKKIENIAADRNDPVQVKAALAGKEFDLVFDNAYDWERGTSAFQVEAAARAVAGDRLKRYVFMSSVAAYGDGLNHHEGDALAPDDCPDPYVRNKATTERMLFRLHQRCGFPVVTLRPPYIYGPGNPYYREQFFWDRIRDNRPLVVPGDGRRLMQFAYVKDLVAMCLKVTAEPHAIGHAFNIANPRGVTQLDAVQAFATAAGKNVTIVRVPRDRILQMGGHVMHSPLYFGMYLDMPPITMVVTKAQRVLGFKPTDFPTGLKETYRWYLRHAPKKTQDYSFEDSLMSFEPVAG